MWCFIIQRREYFILLNMMFIFSLLTDLNTVQTRRTEIKTWYKVLYFHLVERIKRKCGLLNKAAIKSNTIFLESYLCSAFMCMKEQILKFLAPTVNKTKTLKRRQISLILHECFCVHSHFYGHTGFNFSVLHHPLVNFVVIRLHVK